mgnify:FL=1
MSVSYKPASRSSSTPSLHALLVQKPSELAATLQDSISIQLPQKPSTLVSSNIQFQRKRNLSMSSLKLSDIFSRGEDDAEPKDAQFVGSRNFVANNSRSQFEKRLRSPNTSQRSLTRSFNLSREEKPSLMIKTRDLLDRSSLIAKPVRSSQIFSEQRYSNVSSVTTALESRNEKINLNHLKMKETERLYQNAASALQNNFVTSGQDKKNSSESDKTAQSTFKESFAQNSRFVKKPKSVDGKGRRHCQPITNADITQSLQKIPLSKPISTNFATISRNSAEVQSAVKNRTKPESKAPVISDEDKDFMSFLKKLNEDQIPHQAEKIPEKMQVHKTLEQEPYEQFKEEINFLFNAEEKPAPTFELECAENEVKNHYNDRKVGLKQPVLPVIEKKRLAYMKSVVPIEEEDESTRRSLAPSTRTKDSGSWKNSSVGRRGDEFVGVLERLLTSSRKSISDI